MPIDQLWEQIVPIHNIDKELFSVFECGHSAFDRWLRDSAHNAALRGECVVHVCIDKSGIPVAFFTLSATSINSDNLSRNQKGGMHGPIPATLLGKMGVRTDIQGNGCGTRVLHRAMKYALDSALIVSSRLLVVDALTTDLIPWYTKRGFKKLPSSERRLVCKMSDVEKICKEQTLGYFD